MADVHPLLLDKIGSIMIAMRELGFPMKLVSGVRTAEQQQELYAQGRTKPGPIVTYLDGVKKKSNHQVKEDGFGHAVDCAFLENGKPSWSLNLPWKLYGEMAKTLGLKWGGDWKRFTDLPHVEL